MLRGRGLALLLAAALVATFGALGLGWHRWSAPPTAASPGTARSGVAALTGEWQTREGAPLDLKISGEGLDLLVVGLLTSGPLRFVPAGQEYREQGGQRTLQLQGDRLVFQTLDEDQKPQTIVLGRRP